MITLDKIRSEIQKTLEHGCMSSDCVQDLVMLYWLEGQMSDREKPTRHEHKHYKMDRGTAEQWVRHMENADGSTGEHWTYDQTTQVMKQRNIDCEPAEFYAAMNMLWSDYGKVAEKFGVSNVEYWAELSKAFLMDKDAEDDKLALYYECIVRK